VFWQVYERLNSSQHTTPEFRASVRKGAREAESDSLPSKGPLKGLIVSTRPDCFDQEKAKLLAGFMEQGMEVWVELGLQSAHEETLSFLHRKHGVEVFLDAMDIAKQNNLKRTVHLILGLPGESRK